MILLFFFQKYIISKNLFFLSLRFWCVCVHTAVYKVQALYREGSFKKNSDAKKVSKIAILDNHILILLIELPIE
jgi:hypothetical protein